MKLLLLVSCLIAFSTGALIPSGRIVGGDETPIDKVNYQASLRYHDGHECGACILDQDTLITAAHCVSGLNANKLSVRIGSSKHWEGEQHKIETATIHPNYKPTNNHVNDIAVLKTASIMEYGPTVQAIGMEMPGMEVPAATTCMICGWGTLNENSQIISETLRCVDVEIITLDSCRAQYGYNNVTTDMLCAQTLGHDVCQGDSGGALVCNGLVAGIASWARGCARPHSPGVYTKMTSYFEWVDDQME